MKGFEDYVTVSKVCRRQIKVGDYGCEFEDGDISQTIFERKSLADLYGTLTSGYKRFKEEVKLAQNFDLRLVLLIEGAMVDLCKYVVKMREKGIKLKREPHEIIQQAFTIRERYGLETHWCKNRPEMVRFIVETYNAEGREKIRKGGK